MTSLRHSLFWAYPRRSSAFRYLNRPSKFYVPLQNPSSTDRCPVKVLCLPVQANSLALHEFGKDLERHVGSVNMAAILLASAVGSGLAATHFGLGPSAVPLGASGGRCHVVRRRHAASLVPMWSGCFGEGTLGRSSHSSGVCGFEARTPSPIP